MDISVMTMDGFTYRITCDNPQVIGAWFADLLPMIQSANTHMMPIRLNVFPTGDYNSVEWQQAPVNLTESRLRWLAKRFADWREEDTA